MPYRFSYISMIWNVLPRSTLKTVVIAFFIILSISTTQYFFIAKKKVHEHMELLRKRSPLNKN